MPRLDRGQSGGGNWAFFFFLRQGNWAVGPLSAGYGKPIASRGLEHLGNQVPKNLVEFVHQDRHSNIDVHCLAISYINFLVGKYIWFVSPPDGVCTSYPHE